MIRVAIIEDEANAAALLSRYISEYAKESGERFDVSTFVSAVNFLSEYKKTYDIVFMDIELPDLNGFEAAMKLRKYDKQTVIIFVTNMSQFAVRGYEADALDFIVKPVSYPNFVMKLGKAVRIVNANRGEEFAIYQNDGIRRIPTKSIIFIETLNHKLIYHTTEGDVEGHGSLTGLEQKLAKYDFMRCNSCYLVNPKFIDSVKGFSVFLRGGRELKISQPKRKAFLELFANWLGAGNYL